MRASCISLVALSCALLLAPVAASREHRDQLEAPNVLMISIDDLNDWVGCLGGHPQARTPNIDRLADASTLFANAHCQAPVCNPSRVSLMTGRYPHSTGVYFLSPGLEKAPNLSGVKTLPQAFAEAGYQTLAAGKLFHGSDGRYFQEYAGRFGGMGPKPKVKISHPGGHPLWDWGAYPDTDAEMPDSKIADWATEMLQTDLKVPFFMGVGFMRPHVPMYAPQKWFDLHPLEQVLLPKTLENDRDDLSPFTRDLTTLKHITPTQAWMESNRQWQHAVQSYLASTTFVDHYVGRVLKALERSQYRRNTIVVLWSDHGFHLGEKRRWAKRSLWEDGTRVPLIIRVPGLASGQRCARPTELLDVYPTLLELAGLPLQPGLEGQSLVPLLKDAESEWDFPAITTFGKGNHSVRSTRYRFIQYLDGSAELYDHTRDPHEWENLADSSEYESVLAWHQKFLPVEEAEILPGKSTGHNAYAASVEKHMDSSDRRQ